MRIRTVGRAVSPARRYSSASRSRSAWRAWAIWCIKFGVIVCSQSSYRSGPGLTARVSLSSCSRIVLGAVEATGASSATITEAVWARALTSVWLSSSGACLSCVIRLDTRGGRELSDEFPACVVSFLR
jgi:hypothetical protein